MLAAGSQWTPYDFERDGLDVFDGRSCDYYLLCYTDSALENGNVIKVSNAGADGLYADRDESGAFGMAKLDPRSVVAYVEVMRPKLSDEVMLSLARSRKKVALWHNGRFVGEIEASRPRELLDEMDDRAFSISDGTFSMLDGGLRDVPEDSYWVDEVVAVTPLRTDVSVVLTSEKINRAEEEALRSRADSERREIKRVEKRSRRANERRLLQLGTVFDETRAMSALAPHEEKMAPFGLVDEFKAYVSRITEKHFPSHVVTSATDADEVPAACSEAQAVFDRKCSHKLNRLLSELPSLEHREKIRSDFEARTGLKLLFLAEVTQLCDGNRYLASSLREKARSYLSPAGNQRLYAREDIERGLGRH